MGIDIQLYRLRIGLFGPGRGYTPKTSDKYTKYETHIKSPDIHYRMFATLFLITVILKISEHIHQQLHSMDDRMLMGYEVCLRIGPTEISYTRCRNRIYGTAWFEYDSTHGLNNYNGFAQRLLVLSRDVESNPGPTDMDTILSAIQSSENKILGEIRSVRSELVTIKNDIATLKSDQIKTKLEINTVQ